MALDEIDPLNVGSQAVVEARPVLGVSIDHDHEMRGPTERIDRRSHPVPKARALDGQFRKFRNSHGPRLPRAMRASQRSVSNEAATIVAPAQQAIRPTRSPLAAWLTERNLWIRLRLATDVVALAISVTVAMSLSASASVGERCLTIAFALGVLATIHARPAPDDRLQASVLATFGNVLGWCSLAAMMTIAVDSIFGGSHSVSLAFLLWALSVGLLGLTRVLLLVARRHGMRRHGLATPTLIVGAGIVGAHLAHRLTSESYGLRPVGYLDADPLPRMEGSRAPTLPVLGSPDDLEEAVATTGATHVILSFSSGPDHMLVATVRRCQQLGIGVSLVPRLYESINERSTLDHVGGVPLLTLRPVDPKGWQFAIKHAIDRSAALVTLLLLSPLMALIAILVRLSSPGPVLFRQQRVGRDGRSFDVLKFRTMRAVPAAEVGWF